MFMDIDFDDQSLDLAANNAKAGVKFKPKPKSRLRKQASVSTSQAVSKEDLYDGSNQSILGVVSEKNVDEVSRNVHWGIESTNLREQTDVDLENKRCGNKDISALLDVRRRKDSEMLGVLGSAAQTRSINSRKEENHLDMETQEFHSNVIEEQSHGVNKASEPHYPADDFGYFSTGTSDPEFIVNEKPKDEALNSKNVTFDDLLQEELYPEETVPEMDTGKAPDGWEHEEQTNKSFSNNPVAGKEGCFGQTVRERNVRKSKRVADKKKNINEESNQCSEKPEKKKSKQSTRQKTLEKELLETPEDEIQFLPIKDMLKLVDYREYLERKEPQNQESTSKHHSQDDGSERFNSDDCSENQETSRVEPDLPVNYHTFGHKTARSRWSKQDNELFYEGIREFGSNLAMVQQLFPNRSRQQMKLKFKLEERKHPLKLSNALTSRSKHHTHFQNVIQKLQEEAATREEEEAEIAEEERADVPQNEKSTKSDETEKAEVKESDGGETENGLRSDGGDEDEVECDYWGNYTSDI